MSANDGAKLYDVDIVFCIDATGSMRPFMDIVKKNALKLNADIRRKVAEHDRTIGQLRIRLIAFRDYREYMSDHVPPMLVTDFFTLDEQNTDFENTLRSIKPEGGGDEPEDGLEALAYAMKSKWTPERPGASRRQIISIWSDASTHQLGFGSASDLYPKAMPKDFKELSTWWGISTQSQGALMDYYAKRLLIFAPEEAWWTTIAENWPNVIHVPTATGDGLKDTDYEEILRLLVYTLVKENSQ